MGGIASHEIIEFATHEDEFETLTISLVELDRPRKELIH
jgi:hypothetical protein